MDDRAHHGSGGRRSGPARRRGHGSPRRGSTEPARTRISRASHRCRRNFISDAQQRRRARSGEPQGCGRSRPPPRTQRGVLAARCVQPLQGLITCTPTFACARLGAPPQSGPPHLLSAPPVARPRIARLASVARLPSGRAGIAHAAKPRPSFLASAHFRMPAIASRRRCCEARLRGPAHSHAPPSCGFSRRSCRRSGAAARLPNVGPRISRSQWPAWQIVLHVCPGEYDVFVRG